MQGKLHPSLQAYIDCFLSPPFPKMFPRGGGVWDQDPILMRDFRAIQKAEREWKEVNEKMDSLKNGGEGGAGSILDEYIASLGEDAVF